jgi:malonate-semialdehyde dehydrogenase (acetylating)/methylmalonate-semialdehyde dehydrogenase
MSHEQIQNPADTQLFLDNKFYDSKATQWIDLHDPATNNLVTRVPQATDAELTAAVDSAAKAFPEWKAVSVMSKQQIMFRYTALVRENWDRLAASITLEQGKTFADAKGDVLRGLQVAEHACGIPGQLTGEVLEVAKDMETRQYREPLGVVAAICPFSAYNLQLIAQNLLANICTRLPSYDSSLVHPSRNHDRQHSRYQAIRTRSRRMHDPRRAR